jgi:hypothetical protein
MQVNSHDDGAPVGSGFWHDDKLGVDGRRDVDLAVADWDRLGQARCAEREEE